MHGVIDYVIVMVGGRRRESGVQGACMHALVHGCISYIYADMVGGRGEGERGEYGGACMHWCMIWVHTCYSGYSIG